MKTYSFEVFNEETKRVDVAVHISGEPSAHLVFKDDGSTDGVKSSFGKPLNEKRINGNVSPETIEEAKIIAIECMIKKRNSFSEPKGQPRLF